MNYNELANFIILKRTEKQLSLQTINKSVNKIIPNNNPALKLGNLMSEWISVASNKMNSYDH